MLVYALSDVGLRRETNQDSYICDQERGLFLIADGMGGYEGGEIASSTAAEVFRDHFQGVVAENYRAEFSNLISIANDEICKKSANHSNLQNMGTTLLALVLGEQDFFIGHIGDCRAYLLRDGEILQLTEDHNLSGAMMREGQLTEKEAMHHYGKNLLTRSLGRHNYVRIDFIDHDFKENDYIFLCSDGLTGLLETTEMKQIIEEGGDDLEASCKTMLKWALDRGGDDNITMILLKNS